MNLEIENLTQYSVPLNKLQNIATNLTHRDVDLIICDNTFIKEVNLEHRRKTDATDVLSFPIRGIEGDPSHVPLGSIIISMDKVREGAKQYKHAPDEELQLLFIHGLLHLLGNDHTRDNGEMRREEELLIQYYNLPHSLIVRTGEE